MVRPKWLTPPGGGGAGVPRVFRARVVIKPAGATALETQPQPKPLLRGAHPCVERAPLRR